jgi:uncharacterized protein YpbB
MRIWDIHPRYICTQHLLGQHNELHCIFKTLHLNRKPWSNHPETKRWQNKLQALHAIHELIVQEFANRNINHKSPLPQIKDNNIQTIFLHSIEQQHQLLLQKSKSLHKCQCNKFLPEQPDNINIWETN